VVELSKESEQLLLIKKIDQMTGVKDLGTLGDGFIRIDAPAPVPNVFHHDVDHGAAVGGIFVPEFHVWLGMFVANRVDVDFLQKSPSDRIVDHPFVAGVRAVLRKKIGRAIGVVADADSLVVHGEVKYNSVVL